MRDFEREDIARAFRPLAERRQKPKGLPDTTILQIELIGSFDSGGAWKITGIDTNGDLLRERMQGFRDYSKSNSVGTRGVMQIYILMGGSIYEIKAPLSWKKIDQYFCRVIFGQIIRMNIYQVIAWLKNNWA